ncbi:MAG: hypothetical protein INQ03_12600 [Candidatus Heimdallarchaeota archaeon]|nr:hypothetical protein [Candidatus Heimdallarchaeota archaeon]
MVDVLLILNMAFVVIQVILLAVFFIQSKKLGRNSTLLIIGLVSGIIASILSIIPEMDLYIGSGRITLSLQLMAFGLEYILLYIHFNFSVSENLNTVYISMLSLFAGIFTVYSIKFMLEQLEDFDELMWDLSYNSLGFVAFLYISYVMFSSYRYSKEKEALIQGVGTMLLVIGFIVGALTTPIIRNGLELQIEPYYADVVKAIGALLFISIFAFNANFVERIAVDTYGILVFDNAGRELGFYNVKTKKNIESAAIPVDPALFVPLVSALLSFVKEALGTQSYMRSINGVDKAVVFEMGSTIHTAMITEKSTRLLNQSMKSFQHRCEQIVNAQMESEFNVGIVDEEAIKSSVRSNFPYIEVIDTN